ncbi:Polygalacturonase ADPG1 [Abeliophyllum distichum]|uniref:endo-polygalacturonase n=1 Tax=Abeliophyllum distichum TaxID=126358 RepID=A0ABD1QUV4_9LAMI
MAFEKYTISFILIVLSLISCCVSLRNDLLDNYIEEDSGYDFRAFPSYFGLAKGIKLHNSSKIETDRYSHFNKFQILAASTKTINVHNFGAQGDGRSDDTKAFQKAWEEACSSSSAVNILVPKGKNYLLKPITFSGPCKSEITIQIAGTLVASNDRSDYSKDGRHWLLFDSVQNLIVEGGGTINGNGNVWWQNSCKINKAKTCKDAPTALTFDKCTNLEVKNLKIKNAQQIHLSFENCMNVEASNLVVNAPEKSPNTDGIHVTGTQNIQISSDDCISIVSGSKKVRATDITCGPGHGISIGSLGSGNSEAYVSDVVLNGAKLSGTSNGLRIKTWQGGSGSASNIKFQNVEMQNVKNPIIIDQSYCDQTKPCKEQSSAVQVRNVVYQNIKGTSASDVAINFDCSKKYPCQGILLQNVNLGSAKAECNNVNLKNIGSITPLCS